MSTSTANGGGGIVKFFAMLGLAVSVTACSSVADRFDLDRDKRPKTAFADPGLPQTRDPILNSAYMPAHDPIQTSAISPKSGGRYNRRVTRAPLDETPQYRNPQQSYNQETGMVSVQAGDTLYAISRRYNIAVNKLIAVNNLPAPYHIKTGQRLRLSKSKVAVIRKPRRLDVVHQKSRTAKRHVSRIISSTPKRGHSRAKTYKVQSGETLYRIAVNHGVKAWQLAAYNNISAPYTISVGQVLKVSGKASGPIAAVKTKPVKRVTTITKTPGRVLVLRKPKTRRAPVRTKPIALVPRKPKSKARITVARLNKPAKSKRKTRIAVVRSRKPVISKSVKRKKSLAPLPRPLPMSSTKFRWPVKGRIISGFGSKQNGQKNDGINVAVPAGTSVKVAENGVVAYAGNELRGYGNLILVRHARGWITAYAHNGKLMVRRGDKVVRGQIIAKAGRTGSVTRPQLHFEIRKGAKAVNPMQYLAPTHLADSRK